jgi:hypothetical protein
MRIGTRRFTAMLRARARQNESAERSRSLVTARRRVGSLPFICWRGADTKSRQRPEYRLDSYSTTRRDDDVSRDELTKNRTASNRALAAASTPSRRLARERFSRKQHTKARSRAAGMAASHELNTTVWRSSPQRFAPRVSSFAPRRRNERGVERLASDVERNVLANLSRTEPLSNIVMLANEILDGHVPRPRRHRRQELGSCPPTRSAMPLCTYAL